MAFATIAIAPAFAAGVADASLAPIELTFPYRLELDMRRGVAYPDVSERPDGLIHCVHDYNRRAPGGGIILDVFTEADVKAGKIVSPQGRLHTIVRQNAKPRFASRTSPIRRSASSRGGFRNGRRRAVHAYP